jgi:hypothetical protein
MTDELRFNSWQWQENTLFSDMSIPDSGSLSLLFDGYEGPFPRGNWLGHNAEVKNVWNYTSLSHVTSWCDA